MKILIFTNVFFPSIGGIENMTLYLVKEFIKEGHTVKVITNQKPAIQLDNFEIYHSPGYFKMIKLFFWCNIFYMPNISLKGVWLMAFNPSKKWVISHNDFYLRDFHRFEIKVKRLLIKFASNIAVSKSVANDLNTQSEIIYNCYDNTVFKIYEDESKIFDFVFVGRLVSQKGCDLLIRACKDLDRPFTLNIIGDGPELNKLKALAINLNLENSIKFIGFLQGESLARMLNKHKVLIIPSIEKEGFGIVALEGMACGCKIIAASAGGLYEAVNKFGKIFKMQDKNELSFLLNEDIITYAEETDLVKEELKNYLNKHTSNIVAHKYLSFFKG